MKHVILKYANGTMFSGFIHPTHVAAYEITNDEDLQGEQYTFEIGTLQRQVDDGELVMCGLEQVDKWL
jgi:hypothetical protein